MKLKNPILQGSVIGFIIAGSLIYNGIVAQPSSDPTGMEGISTPEPSPNPTKDSEIQTDSGIDTDLGTIEDPNQNVEPALRTDADGNWVAPSQSKTNMAAATAIMPLPAAVFIPTIAANLLFPSNGSIIDTQNTRVEENLGSFAILRGINRINGTYLRFRINQNQVVNYEGLNIKLNACYRAAPENTDESWANVEITEPPRVAYQQLAALPQRDRVNRHKKNETRLIKRGWIIASSPTVTPVDHEYLDIALISCEGGNVTRTIIAAANNSIAKPKAGNSNNASRPAAPTNSEPKSEPVAIAPAAVGNNAEAPKN